LCLLRHRGIEAVTWGVPDSADQDGNDAHIARLLASALAVPHRFFARDSHADAAEVVLERFIAAGEGRVARISGYVDGFRIWKTLFDEGYDGISRGDEAFGSVPVSTPYAVRFTASLTTLADYFSREERETFELPEQQLPDVALATRVAIPSLAEVLADRRVQEILLAELTSERSAAVLSPLLRARCCAALRAAGRELGSTRRETRSRPVLLRAVPPRLRAVLRTLRLEHT
jgi:hypothetical protein